MKKVRIAFLMLIVLHLIYLIPLFRYPFYQSHDGESHVARFGAYVKAFQDHHVPPRWAGDLNYRYGSPVFNFYYPLSGYVGAAFYTLGFNLEDSYKIIAGVAFIFAFITMFLWTKELFDHWTALLTSLLYSLAPYRFLNLYVRGDIAELLSMAIVPLVCLMIDRYCKTQKQRFLLIGGILYALTILSHHGLALLFSPVFLAYGIVRALQFHINPLRLTTLFVIGLGLSSFFWIPALGEQRYTHLALFVGNMYRDHFPTLSQLIYSPWGFGDMVTKAGGLSPQIGPILVVLALFSLTALKVKRKSTIPIVFWLTIGMLSIVVSLQVSNPLWLNLPLLKNLQFPWRLVSVSTFASAILAGFTIQKLFAGTGKVTLLILVLSMSLSFVKIRAPIHHPDSYYFNYLGTTNFHRETSPKWSAGDPSEPPKAPALVASGRGTIAPVRRTTIQHNFTVEATTPLVVVDNTFYFPGWQVRIDGTKVPIEFQDINYRGLITFAVPPGMHSIAVTFGESPIRLVSDVVSLGTTVATVILFIWTTKTTGYLYAKTHS